MTDKKAQRTTLPFDGGLSPATVKSRPSHLFGDTPLITDILNRDVSKIMDLNTRGDWASGEEEHDYKDDGDKFMMDERIREVLMNMDKKPSESWVVDTFSGKQLEFPSYDVAFRVMNENGIRYRSIRRKFAQAGGDIVTTALSSCGMTSSSADNGRSLGACFHIGGGIWVTCAHCVRKYDRTRDRDVSKWHMASISIRQGDEEEAAVLQTVNLLDDIAILKCSMQAGVLKMGSSAAVKIGAGVIAVGSPKGYENNVSEGIVGGKDRVVFFFEGAPEYIFTDAQVLPGNSGGPLIELDTGTVIGMMSLIIPAEGLYGLNAALPVERIRAMLVR